MFAGCTGFNRVDILYTDKISSNYVMRIQIVQDKDASTVRALLRSPLSVGDAVMEMQMKLKVCCCSLSAVQRPLTNAQSTILIRAVNMTVNGLP